MEQLMVERLNPIDLYGIYGDFARELNREFLGLGPNDKASREFHETAFAKEYFPLERQFKSLFEGLFSLDEWLAVFNSEGGFQEWLSCLLQTDIYREAGEIVKKMREVLLKYELNSEKLARNHLLKFSFALDEVWIKICGIDEENEAVILKEDPLGWLNMRIAVLTLPV